MIENLKLDIKEFELNNGLVVIMSKKNTLPIVSMNMTFHVGSKDEIIGKTGIAHLLEHLMFEGSPNTGKGEFDEILNKNGGDSNAYTSWDLTGYYVVLPSSKLELAFWLDSDRLAGFNISEDSFQIQKSVVLEEKLQMIDNTPYGTVEEESSKRLFKNSGYRWPIIGYKEDIVNLKLTDIKEFFYKYYRPNNAVLSIVGDIDYIETEKLIKKYYGDIVSSEIPKRKDYIDDFLKLEKKDIIKSNVNLPGKFLFYLIPKIGSKEYYELKILNNILSSGESSLLYNELIYNLKIAYEVESFLYGMEHISIFFVNIIASNGVSPEELELEFDKIIDNIKNGKFSDEDLMKAKNKLETNFYTNLNSSIFLSEKLSEYKIFFNDYEKFFGEIKIYENITKKDIINIAKHYLNKEQRVNLSYIPKE